MGLLSKIFGRRFKKEIILANKPSTLLGYFVNTAEYKELQNRIEKYNCTPERYAYGVFQTGLRCMREGKYDDAKKSFYVSILAYPDNQEISEILNALAQLYYLDKASGNAKHYYGLVCYKEAENKANKKSPVFDQLQEVRDFLENAPETFFTSASSYDKKNHAMRFIHNHYKMGRHIGYTLLQDMSDHQVDEFLKLKNGDDLLKGAQLYYNALSGKDIKTNKKEDWYLYTKFGLNFILDSYEEFHKDKTATMDKYHNMIYKDCMGLVKEI